MDEHPGFTKGRPDSMELNMLGVTRQFWCGRRPIMAMFVIPTEHPSELLAVFIPGAPQELWYRSDFMTRQAFEGVVVHFRKMLNIF